MSGGAECELCGTVVRASYIRNHIVFSHPDSCGGWREKEQRRFGYAAWYQSTGEPRRCEGCGESYTSKKGLQIHLFTYHPGSSKGWARDREHLMVKSVAHSKQRKLCDDCGASFNSAVRIRAHIGNVHDDLSRAGAEYLAALLAKGKGAKGRTLQVRCDECGFCIQGHHSKDALIRHMCAEHKTLGTPEAVLEMRRQKRMSTAQLRAAARSCREVAYCDECTFGSTRRLTVCRHYLYHHAPKDHFLWQKLRLKVLKRTAETAKRGQALKMANFSCDECLICTKWPGKLFRHFVRKHGNGQRWEDARRRSEAAQTAALNNTKMASPSNFTGEVRHLRPGVASGQLPSPPRQPSLSRLRALPTAATVMRADVKPAFRHSVLVHGIEWSYFNHSCWEVAASKANFPNSIALYHGRGGHVASLHSREEMNFVAGLGRARGLAAVRTGALDLFRQWRSGEEWRPEVPALWHPANVHGWTTQKCMHLVREAMSFNDNTCDHATVPALCEAPAVNGTCPWAGWRGPHQGVCYWSVQRSPPATDYKASILFCERRSQEQSRLAEIRSKTQLAWIKESFTANFYYIGMEVRMHNVRAIRWLDGSAVDFLLPFSPNYQSNIAERQLYVDVGGGGVADTLASARHNPACRRFFPSSRPKVACAEKCSQDTGCEQISSEYCEADSIDAYTVRNYELEAPEELPLDTPFSCNHVKERNSSATSGWYNLRIALAPTFQCLKGHGLCDRLVYCDMDTEFEGVKGGWTVIHRRVDNSVTFVNRTRDDYAHGFGPSEGGDDYFIGVHQMLTLTAYKANHMIVAWTPVGGVAKSCTYLNAYLQDSRHFALTFDKLLGCAPGSSNHFASGRGFDTLGCDTTKGLWWSGGCPDKHPNGAWPPHLGDEPLASFTMLLRSFDAY